MKSPLAATLLLLTSLSATSAFAAAGSSTTPTTATTSTAAQSQLTLKYFDIRGAAETCRILFALAQQPYTDHRYAIDPTNFNSPTFLAAKEAGDLKMNLNRAPVLVVTPDNDGKTATTTTTTTIGQSKAIERYLAKQFGFMGSTPEEEAMIDCITEHCRDVKDAARYKGFSKFTKNKTDEEKALLRKEWFDTDMPAMLRKINDVVQETGSVVAKNSEGYAFGSSVTFADVAIWALLRDCGSGDAEDTKKAAEGCEALNAIVEMVAKNPGVARYLEERPDSMF